LAVAAEPETEAELQVAPTAVAGTVLHPVKVVEFAATLKVHVRPLAPPLIFHCTVALELPATALPGRLAANVMVAGVALIALGVVAIGFKAAPEASEGLTGPGRRGLSLGF
jgi:hypothetical protein